MDLRQMQIVLAVAEHGGFTAAARRLHLAQATVSATVRSVERELGTILFERTTHRVALTQAGLAYVSTARGALDAARQVRVAVQNASEQIRGTVEVGVMQGPHTGFDIALRTLRIRYPHVRIKLRQGPSDEIRRELRRRHLDLAVLATTGLSVPGLTEVELMTEELVGVCSPENELAGEPAVTLGELARSQTDLIEFPIGWAIRSVLDDAFEHEAIQRQSAFEINDVLTFADLVSQDLAIGALPASLAARFPGLQQLQLRPSAPTWTVSVLHPEGKLSPAARALMEQVVKDRPGLVITGSTNQGGVGGVLTQ